MLQGVASVLFSHVGMKEQVKHGFTKVRYSVLQYGAVCCSILQYVAVRCSVSQCVAVCCSVLQYDAVCSSVLQCVEAYCSVIKCVAVYCRVLQCVAVCCSVLQCVAVCCSVLQCVAVYCSVLQYLVFGEPPWNEGANCAWIHQNTNLLKTHTQKEPNVSLKRALYITQKSPMYRSKDPYTQPPKHDPVPDRETKSRLAII